MFKSRAVPADPPQQIHDAMARGEIVLVDVREPSGHAAGLPVVSTDPSTSAVRDRF